MSNRENKWEGGREGGVVYLSGVAEVGDDGGDALG